ncbi:hypothetical protein NW754_001615 [Fusarium falciforme]|nr:hypothetical protein NW754_001615 [Fusarium falciforme]
MWASRRAAPLKRCLSKDDYDTESIYWTLKAEEEFYTQVEGQVGALKDKIGIVGHRMLTGINVSACFGRDTRFEDLKDPGERSLTPLMCSGALSA